MGFIGKIIQHFLEDAIRETVTEIYPNYTKSSVLCLPSGIDSVPILGDQSIENDDKFDTQIGIDIDNASHSAVIGVIPPSKVFEGEIKVFSRDPKTGVVNSEIYFRADKLLVIKNDVENLKLILNDLIKEIKALKTFGSPVNHTVDPASQALLDAVDARINALLGV